MKTRFGKSAVAAVLAALLIVSPVLGANVYAASGSGLLSGHLGIKGATGVDGLSPRVSFSYRFQDELDARQAYEEQKKAEAEEAARIAAEEQRLEELRRNAASLTDAELSEAFSDDYYVERLKTLGFYTEDYADESVNYRNAVVRLQASINMPIDATLGPVSKRALLEYTPVVVTDEVSDPASDGFWITINKSKNILTVYQGASVYKKFPVATGKTPGRTPEGKFSFVTKAVNPAWGGAGSGRGAAGGSPGNPLGRRWLGLSVGGGGTYGVHGNAAATSIGTYASLGCVRMINADVESMYEYIPVGTPVWIGTDDRLADYGVRQYHTVTQPPAPEPAPEPGPAEPELLQPAAKTGYAALLGERQ